MTFLALFGDFFFQKNIKKNHKKNRFKPLSQAALTTEIYSAPYFQFLTMRWPDRPFQLSLKTSMEDTQLQKPPHLLYSRGGMGLSNSMLFSKHFRGLNDT